MVRLRLLFCGLLIAASFPTSSRLLAIVTSDFSGSHITSPGDLVFGLDHDGVGKAEVHFDDGFTGLCTTSLLTEGDRRFAILAGHCVGDGPGFAVTSVDVTWETTTGPVTATASTSLGQITLHPTFLANALDVFKGYDVAILEFSDPVDPIVPSYEIYEGSSEVGSEIVSVGYGLTGLGSTGAIPGSGGTKRAGRNRWESLGLGDLGAPLVMANDTQLTFDFDSGIPVNDGFGYFFGTSGPFAGDPAFDDVGFGADEIGLGVGDSGGPGFIFDDGVYKIAGVNSYGTRLVEVGGTLLTEPLMDPPGSSTSDVDGTFNSSWGEFFVHSRLSHPDNLAFIRSVIGTSSPECDFDGSTTCDITDLDLLYGGIATDDSAFDLSGDGTTDNDDITVWLGLAGAENSKVYLRGDTDLDGAVGGGDFTELASNFGSDSAGWAEGNFDGKRGGSFSVGGSDFTALAASFGFVSPVRAVPEPSGLIPMLLGFFAIGWTRKKAPAAGRGFLRIE